MFQYLIDKYIFFIVTLLFAAMTVKCYKRRRCYKAAIFELADSSVGRCLNEGFFRPEVFGHLSRFHRLQKALWGWERHAADVAWPS